MGGVLPLAVAVQMAFGSGHRVGWVSLESSHSEAREAGVGASHGVFQSRQSRATHRGMEPCNGVFCRWGGCNIGCNGGVVELVEVEQP